MRTIDNFLNKITMYRVSLYSLTALAVISIAFGFLGVISYGGLALFLSLALILFVCFVSNTLFAKFLGVTTNVESVWISGFILFFILSPLSTFSDVWTYIIVGVLAMASKSGGWNDAITQIEAEAKV